jgi:hypothetical protein
MAMPRIVVQHTAKSVLRNGNAKNCHSEHSEESAFESNKKQIPQPEPAPSEVEGASE